jgi:hypothetical protein
MTTAPFSLLAFVADAPTREALDVLATVSRVRGVLDAAGEAFFEYAIRAQETAGPAFCGELSGVHARVRWVDALLDAVLDGRAAELPRDRDARWRVTAGDLPPEPTRTQLRALHGACARALHDLRADFDQPLDWGTATPSAVLDATWTAMRDLIAVAVERFQPLADALAVEPVARTVAPAIGGHDPERLRTAMFAAMTIANRLAATPPDELCLDDLHPGFWYCEAVRETVRDALGSPIDDGAKHGGPEMDAARAALAEEIARLENLACLENRARR